MHARSHASANVGSAPRSAPVDPELIDAFVTASRVLVAVAARSLAELGEDITLPQYRALVVLAARGPQRAVDLADALDVTPGTGSRMIERLVRKRLVRRVRSREDRRTVQVQLSESGREIVSQVTARRQAEIGAILQAVPIDERGALTASLRIFATAAGEMPADDWALGWDQ